MPRIDKLHSRMLASDKKCIEVTSMYTECDLRTNALQSLSKKISTSKLARWVLLQFKGHGD